MLPPYSSLKLISLAMRNPADALSISRKRVNCREARNRGTHGDTQS
jgi:hypothetical protein